VLGFIPDSLFATIFKGLSSAGLIFPNMNKSYKIDFHTHSIISHDGGISAYEYDRILTEGKVDVVAITDHNKIDFALEMYKKHGNKIIVGEEILTKEGEIIGLFLNSKIEPYLSLEETVQRIREQNGLVYVPHPFEVTRKGFSKQVLQRVASMVDIIEVFNARSKEPWKSNLALRFAEENNLVFAASSDAHSVSGISAHSIVSEIPERDNLLSLLNAGSLHKERAGMFAYAAPTINRIKKKFHF
jgi:predicted metal-dependent phosphoesterase TrpH